MKLLNTLLTVLLITILPSLGWSTPLDEFVNRDGLYYPKFSDVPFTGKVTGKTQGYLKNGKEEGDWSYYQDNGQLHNRGTYLDGKKEGLWVGYYDNGQLFRKIEYKNGVRDGSYEMYWGNGQLESKGHYKKGLQNGVWVAYWVNGQLRFKGKRINDKKEGLWVFYDEEGAPIDSGHGIFKKDVKISD